MQRNKLFFSLLNSNSYKNVIFADMSSNNKKYQGVFHLVLIFAFPVLMLSIFILHSWVIPILIVAGLFGLYFFINKSNKDATN